MFNFIIYLLILCTIVGGIIHFTQIDLAGIATDDASELAEDDEDQEEIQQYLLEDSIKVDELSLKHCDSHDVSKTKSRRVPILEQAAAVRQRRFPVEVAPTIIPQLSSSSSRVAPRPSAVQPIGTSIPDWPVFSNSLKPLASLMDLDTENPEVSRQDQNMKDFRVQESTEGYALDDIEMFDDTPSSTSCEPQAGGSTSSSFVSSAPGSSGKANNTSQAVFSDAMIGGSSIGRRGSTPRYPTAASRGARGTMYPDVRYTPAQRVERLARLSTVAHQTPSSSGVRRRAVDLPRESEADLNLQKEHECDADQGLRNKAFKGKGRAEEDSSSSRAKKRQFDSADGPGDSDASTSRKVQKQGREDDIHGCPEDTTPISISTTSSLRPTKRVRFRSPGSLCQYRLIEKTETIAPSRGRLARQRRLYGNSKVTYKEATSSSRRAERTVGQPQSQMSSVDSMMSIIEHLSKPRTLMGPETTRVSSWMTTSPWSLP